LTFVITNKQFFALQKDDYITKLIIIALQMGDYLRDSAMGDFGDYLHCSK
jgi:hypothetical protein